MMKIKENLELLGLDSTYLGYHYIAYSLKLMMDKDGPAAMKVFYIETAKRYQTNPDCVEKDIRTASEVLWRESLKSGLITFPSKDKRPSNAKLLNTLKLYMKNVCKSDNQV